jgi:hypothetical protein
VQQRDSETQQKTQWWRVVTLAKYEEWEERHLEEAKLTGKLAEQL